MTKVTETIKTCGQCWPSVTNSINCCMICPSTICGFKPSKVVIRISKSCVTKLCSRIYAAILDFYSKGVITKNDGPFNFSMLSDHREMILLQLGAVTSEFSTQVPPMTPTPRRLGACSAAPGRAAGSPFVRKVCHWQIIQNGSISDCITWEYCEFRVFPGDSNMLEIVMS